MKKFFFVIIAAFCLFSCTKDLTEYYKQADELEAANKKQEDLNKQQEKENLKLQEEALLLQAKLDSLADSYHNAPVETGLVAMGFSAAENSILSEDLQCDISKEGTVECWIPKIVTSKELKPRFSFHGTEVTINGVTAISGQSKYDFTKPVIMSVKGADKTVNYTIYVHAYTGLPILQINTTSGLPITSKEFYIGAKYKLTEDVKTRDAGDVMEALGYIKGRGNSSWVQPKKPYRLKFSEKQSLLGEHKDKSWVLIPNYSDKSMIRNRAACYMSSISSLEYTPKSHFVEVILNGRYDGTYELCEKIKVDKHRVNVGDDGFLLEVDKRSESESDAVIFNTTYLEHAVNIKEPEVAYEDANYNYIKNYVMEAEAALFGPAFWDANVGWKKYLDMDSFVDWYLINEISKNIDGAFWSSCFMNLKRGGKLKMGPVWDYDVAFGNINQKNQTANQIEGFHIKNVMWFTRLFQDPAFVARVKERFNYFYSHWDDIVSYVNEDAQYLHYSVEENEKRWGTFYEYTWSNYDIWGAYQNEVQSMKEWTKKRMNWLKSQFDKM